jgi:hypothetical protein
VQLVELLCEPHVNLRAVGVELLYVPCVLLYLIKTDRNINTEFCLNGYPECLTAPTGYLQLDGD